MPDGFFSGAAADADAHAGADAGLAAAPAGAPGAGITEVAEAGIVAGSTRKPRLAATVS
jgi:hypothetical protein